jgi:hypothetical protein
VLQLIADPAQTPKWLRGLVLQDFKAFAEHGTDVRRLTN